MKWLPSDIHLKILEEIKSFMHQRSETDNTNTDVRSTTHSAVEIQMITLPELDVRETASEKSLPVLSNMNPLHAVKAKLQVYVGGVEVTVGELMNLKEHQVLALDTDLDQTIDLLLEGHVIARGKLVALDGQFAIQIAELPISLKS
ncbi:FliM/FliN family flagellar motor switch protein [Undibacterium sp. Ji49W]|uniref:FliM/FliN family flagellar motor switch protein n=1 Tax=Undibacterium sp. Ji49W TaxID=3413040 RepID=UPI003BF229E4